MNRYVWLFCLLVLGSLVIIGCGSVNNTPSSTTPVVFYSTAEDTTPVFTPTTLAQTLATWGSGNAVYSVFYTLREYLTSRDEGVIDRANIYKMLYDVDAIFSGMYGSAVTLESAAVINPPFNFSNNITYEAAYNDTANERSIALKETTTEVKAIVTWILREAASPKKMEVGVMESAYNKTTKDITIDFIYCVDYNTDDTACEYNNRTRISGNPETHAFEFKQTIGGSRESNPITQIVAKGVSKGAGNSFLFKVKSGNDSNFSSAKYLVISAEATEATLKAIDPTAEAISDSSSLPASVDSYKSYVTSTDFFEFSDILSDRALLNHGNAKAGTIYLNY
ncbi:MAG: hypothetical protein WCV91_06830 [Candidatus Margulisiibacteriota bacterium]